MSEADPYWWLGYLAASIRHSLKEPPENARSRLRDALARFQTSEACPPELNRALGRQPRPRKAEPVAAAVGGFDLNSEWKPCGNPECRAPIPKRSRKTYCDQMCRNVARDHHNATQAAEHEAEFRARNPHYDQIPY